MSTCVGIDGTGYVYEVAETFPQCSEFALVAPAHLERLTYWADVAIALDPAGPDLYLLMTATMMLFATALGWKILIRQVFNR